MQINAPMNAQMAGPRMHQLDILQMDISEYTNAKTEYQNVRHHAKRMKRNDGTERQNCDDCQGTEPSGVDHDREQQRHDDTADQFHPQCPERWDDFIAEEQHAIGDRSDPERCVQRIKIIQLKRSSGRPVEHNRDQDSQDDCRDSGRMSVIRTIRTF